MTSLDTKGLVEFEVFNTKLIVNGQSNSLFLYKVLGGFVFFLCEIYNLNTIPHV